MQVEGIKVRGSMASRLGGQALQTADFRAELGFIYPLTPPFIHPSILSSQALSVFPTSQQYCWHHLV